MISLKDINIGDLLKDKDLLVRIVIIIFALLISKNIYQAHWAETKKLQTKIQEQDKMLGLSHQIAAQKKEIQNYLAAFAGKQKGTPGILTYISDSAKATNVDILSLGPEAQQDTIFYSVLPIKINLKGDYHTIASFLAKLESCKELLKIDSLNFIGSEQTTLGADVSVSVIYLKE